MMASDSIDIRALMDQAGFVGPVVVPELEPTAPPRFIDWEDFWAKDRTEAEWALEDVLARGRGHSIYARHGTGKSLFTLWACIEMVKAGYVVIYADWEMGEDDLYERLSDMGYGPDTDFSRLRYLMIPDLAPLNTHEGGQQVGAMVDEVQLTWPECNVAVVIDTISRAVVGEENSNDTIQGFYRHTGIELKRRAVTWVRLDHAGHEGSHARGASAKGDDVDVVWKLTLTDDGIELKSDKRRMGWVPERVAFRIMTEPLLSYAKVDGSWPAGTHEVARLLDELRVPVDAGMRSAKTALSSAGKGRRGVVVTAAQRYRRSVLKAREETSGHTPGHTGTHLSGGVSHISGHTEQKARNHGQDTPPDTPGHTSGTGGGDLGPLFREALNPGVSDTDEPFPRGPLNGGPK